ncbi:MAG: thiamine pyrophosphate-dependent enzyme, partial [Anaerolineales bacterium]
FRLTLDKQTEYAHELLERLAGVVGVELAQALRNPDPSSETGIAEQRARLALLTEKLEQTAADNQAAEAVRADARDLLSVASVLVKRSLWIVGGDGWAYDIGYGGLDHVLASGRDVNVLVLDTEVYSNTGGQMSKSTPRGAVAKFAAGGKGRPKKDLGLLAMTYGSVYVAHIALGANDAQTLRAFHEAEAYHGPSLILAYSPCIAHGYDLRHGLEQQKKAVLSGYWPLYRYNPDHTGDGQSPLTLDSKAPSLPLDQYMYAEMRFRVLSQTNPAEAERLLHLAQQDVQTRWKTYEQMAAKGEVTHA